MQQKLKIAALAVGLLMLGGTVQAQTAPNTVTCSLEQKGAKFEGTCSVPCMVNALAIDIDGP
ncbi:MAG: hypothetical protein ACRC56_04395, partial [Bosea sp. (in: a-proteobacteria)]